MDQYYITKLARQANSGKLFGIKKQLTSCYANSILIIFADSDLSELRQIGAVRAAVSRGRDS